PLIIRGPAGRGTIHSGFTHVTDVTPTLLELAGVTHPGQAAGVEPLTGRSLVSVLRDASTSVRTANDTLGYELAGNAALFAGDLKLVRNLPPVATGDWELYDIARDPGETRNLRASHLGDYARLLAAYKEYERTDGVLPLPAGYEPRDQVAMNALRRVILPGLWGPGVLTAGVLLGLWMLLRRRNKT
ncbi:MAG: arylsulfatase, partial [Gammaproteobacteria bacterium]